MASSLNWVYMNRTSSVGGIIRHVQKRLRIHLGEFKMHFCMSRRNLNFPRHITFRPSVSEEILKDRKCYVSMRHLVLTSRSEMGHGRAAAAAATAAAAGAAGAAAAASHGKRQISKMRTTDTLAGRRRFGILMSAKILQSKKRR
jgi:hypothetical protein